MRSPDRTTGASRDPVTSPIQGASPRYYEALDMLRGFAALVVCLYHVSFLFTPDFRLFASGYLCVDLFFLLSGFVIAANYDRKIAEGLTLRAFLVERIARLYPLFALTTLFGLAIIGARQYAQLGPVDLDKVAATFAMNLLMMPSFLPPWGVVSLFPFNGATWSIFFEMWVNVVFFLGWTWLVGRRLALAIAVSGIALIALVVPHATVDVGWGSPSFLAGFARVSFSFFAGVAIYRSRVAERFRLHPAAACIALLLLGAVLNARSFIDPEYGAAADLTTVLVLFPVLIVVFAGIELSGSIRRIATFLGGTSYAVYLLQTPLVVFFSGLPPLVFGKKIAAFAPFAGFVFLPLVLIAAHLSWRYFEAPTKAYVRRTLQPRARLARAGT